jgi:hypothetical protein
MAIGLPKKRYKVGAMVRYKLENRREPGICCNANKRLGFDQAIPRVGCGRGRVIAMSAGAFLNQLLRCAVILALGLSLFACVGLPDWSDSPGVGELGVLEDGWEFPDLSLLPTPPGPPPSTAEHDGVVQALEAARLQNQRAGEDLGSQIENNFEYPTASSN